MPLATKPHVSFAIVDGTPVFLDLARDRYFAICRSMAEALVAMQSSGDISDDHRRQLLATRLFEPAGRPDRARPAEMSAPEVDVRDLASSVRARLADVPSISFAVAYAAIAVRRKRLYQRIELLRALRMRCRNVAPPGQVLQLGASFQRLRPLVPIRPVCLHDSLALAFWLARRGAFANLVFGVKLDPFAAHCWVQINEVVLNDTPDAVSIFTPILVA